MTKKFNILILLFLLLTSALNAQIKDRMNTPARLYSDRITDESGNALSGIQVRVKGKGIITYTDVNGEFKIAARNGDIIVLSRNGKTINSYRLDGSVYYEVQDESDQIETKDRKRGFKTSKKLRVDNTALFETLIDSANISKKNAPTKSIDFIESALKIANQTKSRSQLATSYGVLGDVNMNLKQYDLAVSNYTIAVDNSQNIIFQLKLARALLLNSDYQKSEDQYNSILKNRGVTTAQKIEVYEGLGDIYAKQDQQTKAFNQYQTALTLAKRLSDSAKITDLNAKISSALEAQGETSKAESYLLQSSSQVAQSPQKAVVESKRAADFYSRNNDVDKEVIQREQTLKNLEEVDLDEIIIEDEDGKLTKPKAKLDLGNAYLKQNKQSEAIQVLEESAAEAESSNDIETQKNAIQKLSEVYVSLGDDDKA